MCLRHFEARAQLKVHAENLKYAPLCNLNEVINTSRAILKRYCSDPEESVEAQADFYQQLHAINQNFFRDCSKNNSFHIKREFRAHQKEIKSLLFQAQEIKKHQWDEDWVTLKINKRYQSERAMSSRFDKTSNQLINHGYKLFLISSRLIPEHLDRLHFDFTTYKLKSELEHFYNQHHLNLNVEQKSALSKAICVINNVALINESIWLSKWFTREVSLEDKKSLADSRINDICFRIYQKLDALKVGEKMVIPQRFMDENSVKTSLIELECLREGVYTYSNHQSGVSLSEIVSSGLIKECGYSLLNTDYDSNHWGAHMSWMEWLSNAVDPKVFKSFELFLTSRALKKLEAFYFNMDVSPELKEGVIELDKVGHDVLERNKNELRTCLKLEDEDELFIANQIDSLCKRKPKANGANRFGFYKSVSKMDIVPEALGRHDEGPSGSSRGASNWP